MLKQYCLEGILANESSARTKDFLLWSDLQASNFEIVRTGVHSLGLFIIKNMVEAISTIKMLLFITN